jgi:hypothetical protein
MIYALFVRKYKRSKVLTHPVYDTAQDMALNINKHLDVSVKDIQTLMAKRYVKANSKFGILHLTYKVR